MPQAAPVAYREGVIRPLSRGALVADILVACAMFVVLTPLGLPTYSVFWMAGGIDLLAAVPIVVSGLLMCAGVAVGRLGPGLALALAWAGAIVQMFGGLPPLPVNVAILAVLFATAAWGSTRVFWLGLGSAGVGGVVAALYLVREVAAFGVSGFGMTVTTVMLLAVIAILALGFAWVCGMLWRTVLRSRGIREAKEKAEGLAAEEQERVRIARDMHDIVAHSLAVVIAQADGARYAAASDPEAATEALATISQTSRAALSDVRMLLTQLRHRQGDGPQPTLADLEALFAQVRQAGIEPRVTVDPVPPGEPPGAIQLAVYRILQEALTNALRHGDGDVDVRLAWWPERVDLAVRNAVAERSDAALRQAQGPVASHGLIGMRERAQLVGGTLQAEHADGFFTVQASLPIAGVTA